MAAGPKIRSVDSVDLRAHPAWDGQRPLRAGRPACGAPSSEGDLDADLGKFLANLVGELPETTHAVVACCVAGAFLVGA